MSHGIRKLFASGTNKGTDQLYNHTDQHFCFDLSESDISKCLSSSVAAKTGFVPDLVKKSEARFSHDEASILVKYTITSL